jgi:two-component system CheB/CheR fusion protein
MRKSAEAEAVNNQFPVVGIGASAGGLDAVSEFLKALPSKPGMAFVFVQHMSPSHQSILPEILQKVAPFPVHQITDNIHLERDNLYIIPSNKIVTTTDGILKLAPLNKKQDSGNTINLFFSSLGVVHQSYAVGIVLSGALRDGTVGLQVIKSYGGLTFAQQESSAAFASMPTSAIRSGAVDFILPPADIARQLIEVNSPFNANYTATEVSETLPQQDNEVFKQILTVLRVGRGVDFTYYKQSTLKRRIIRRMALNKVEKPVDYLGFLRENKSEQDALYNDMLISVTNFFRDTQSFDVLCGSIFPDLISKKTVNDSLRIWVAGCATGEEAYSMAICLQEQLGDKASAMKIQIFATDISEIAINKARTGIYNQNELTGISPSRLEQFFIKADGNYQVVKNVRDMCVFANHNLLKDPPFSKIDLVSCRNVMIYLEPVLQKRALTTFHYSLNEYGYLMLGKSESIGSNTEIFSTYNTAEKIYQRKGQAGRFMNVATSGNEQSFRDADKGVQKENEAKDVFKVADDVMLANFMPASVLVNDKFDIIQFRGSTETWLTSPSGKPSFNLLKMDREGLSFELRNILHLAKKTGSSARKYAVFFKLNGLQHYVNIHAVPIKDMPEPYYLVIFQNASSAGIQQSAIERNTDPENINYSESEMRIEQLEKELMQVRTDMRAITEEQETANEELQSANEELLSGSEELQSLNEELETSKEELQSTNEEIMIVNKELLNRNDQLNDSRLYTEGIVNTIRDPLLILDSELRVRRATGGFYSKFKTNEKETEGQFIYDLGNKQWDIPKLRALLEQILPANKVTHDFEVDHVFPTIGRKIMCLNARQIDNINGGKLILMAIEDITEKRTVEIGLAEAERMLSESKERLKFAVESAGLGTWDYDPKTRELVWDKRCREIYGFTGTQKVNIAAFFNVIHPDDKDFVENRIKEIFTARGLGEFDVEFRCIPIDGKIKWLKGKGRAYFNEKGEPIRFIGTILDITFQKIADEATRELLAQKDEFISVASHELKTPITSLKAALQIIERASTKGDNIKAVDGFIQKALKQVDKLTELIRDLLDVTKIQSGKLSLRKTNFSLDELIKECVEDQQNSSKTHQLIIEGDTGVTVNADRNRIEQVMVNLISNAIKYSPNADKVIINLFHSDHVVKVSVTDFGIGMPKDKIPLVFDRFYRVDEDSQSYAGLGLGLYISAEIIQRHGGHISIESTLGKGSTFWFVIPV